MIYESVAMDVIMYVYITLHALFGPIKGKRTPEF